MLYNYVWMIKQKFVILMELFSGFSCLNRADIIKVFDGKVSTAPVIAMLCNEVVGEIT